MAPLDNFPYVLFHGRLVTCNLMCASFALSEIPYGFLIITCFVLRHPSVVVRPDEDIIAVVQI